MIDFVDNYYYSMSSWCDDSKDKELSQQKAFSEILPLIISNELTEKQQRCFKYKYILGKNQEEIAQLMHISQPTVSRHINSAKNAINASLKYCYVALSKGLDEYDRLNNPS